MSRADYRCEHRLRVRWAEIDMQKVVFNGHYLTYIDTAVAEYWREIGLPYPDGYVDRYGCDLYLRKAALEYHGSARYDETLAVLCRVGRLGRSSMDFRFEIWREEPSASQAPLITAHLVYVNVDVSAGKPSPLPEDVRGRVRAYERAAPEQA
ncbi:MAG TPA: thioesterase family protein [Burkholderiales bacterium]|jgi:YbgC/YbaW family acyl-CoA thioester hydrolase|nr:thioesterase family protein [Burkholderiales bacterium]